MALEQPVLTSLGYLVLKAGVHFHQEVDDVLGELGLNGRQFLVLTFLAEDDVLSQLELSRRLALDPTIVVGLLDDLQGRGLLKRDRDPVDRRRHLLELTDDGRKLQSVATDAMRRAEDEYFEPLSPAQREDTRVAMLEVMRSRLPWLAPRPT